MAFAFATSGAAILKAGANASSAITINAAALDLWGDEADALIRATGRNDFSSVKEVCDMIETAYVAQKIINYDMSGYTSRSEAQTMLDILENDIQRGLKLISDDKVLTYWGDTT